MKVPVMVLTKIDTRMIDYSLQMLSSEYQRVSSIYTHVGILLPVVLALGVGARAILSPSILQNADSNFFAGTTLLVVAVLVYCLVRSISHLYQAGVPRGGYESINIAEINRRLMNTGDYGKVDSEQYAKGLARLQELVDSALASAHQQTEKRINSLRQAIRWVVYSGFLIALASMFQIFANTTGA